MKKKGSITVFLAIVFVLLFSFVMTALEGARITGGAAYLKLLAALAGESAKAGYYYPLFEEYGLFGMAAGDEDGFFSASEIKEGFQKPFSYSVEGMSGGILQLEEPEVTVKEYHTLLSDGGRHFLSQIRKQVLLDGTAELMKELLKNQEMKDAVQVEKLYTEQEKALEATATVTEELLLLMRDVDGVQITEYGLYVDECGALQAVPGFLKQFFGDAEEKLRNSYEKEEVYETVRPHFQHPKQMAQQLQGLFRSAMELEKQVAAYDVEIQHCNEQLDSLGEALLSETDAVYTGKLLEEISLVTQKKTELSGVRDVTLETYDVTLMDAEVLYGELKTVLEEQQKQLEKVYRTVERMEKKQFAAALSVQAYEQVLKSVKEDVSPELYGVFEKELNDMKLYVGLEEQGYDTEQMKKTLLYQLAMVDLYLLPEFTGDDLLFLYQKVQLLLVTLDSFSLEGLKFSYGDIVASGTVTGNITETLEYLLGTGILMLTGLKPEEVSRRELTGQELPSAGLPRVTLAASVRERMEQLRTSFEDGGIARVLGNETDGLADAVVLEAYGRMYFSCYRDPGHHTRLLYEREYMAFGNKSDAGNLVDTVFGMVAMRALCSMAGIMKDGGKMAQLQTLAVSLAGFTGVPVVISLVKYGVLLVWALEEAFIEVAALLKGKRLPMLGRGVVLIGELFGFSPSFVERKAEQLAEYPTGLAYEDYLSLLSVLSNSKEKIYRCMDLIQENIRYRYHNGFRMRNMVACAEYQVRAKVPPGWNTPFWRESVYHLSLTEKITY